jgi:hypothetical protein
LLLISVSFQQFKQLKAMKPKIFSFLLLTSLSVIAVKAQNFETWMQENEKLPVEKIYLHTDRAYYFTGETVWFKSYLTDSRSGRLIPGAENIYVHLIAPTGETVAAITVLSANGLVANQLEIPDTLNPGNYLLQATTDYLLNFSPGACFSKNLIISKPARSLRAIESRRQMRTATRMVAGVSFFPEGGKLLEGISNLVAFKAFDKNGCGIDASGAVRDEAGKEVVSFKTDYKGMGLFFMTPQPGKSYQAVVNGFPAFQFRFDSLIVSEEIKIQLVNQTSRELLVNICGNTEKFTGAPFFLANMHGGQTVFYQAFKMEGQNHLLKFESDMLKGGINQLVLLDKNLNPLSELLIFSDNFNLKNLDVRVDKKAVANRSAIKVTISDHEKNGEVANLSATVVHEAALPENGFSQNILSALFIESELNGYIETPAGFFNNNEMNAKAKQRLLMLTKNDRSSYFWNQAPAATKQLDHKQSAGLKLHGIATETATGLPLKNSEITLVIEKNREMAFLTQNTDNEGHFTFSGLLFNDTANVVVQARNKRGRQNTAIQILPPFEILLQPEKIEALGSETAFSEEMEKQKYQQQLSLTSYLRKQGRLRSDKEKAETENRVDSDGRFRIYDKADQVVEIPESEASFGNVLDFLAGKVAGLDIGENSVSIRGTSNIDGNSTPLFLIDGVPLNSGVFSDLPAEVGRNTGEEWSAGETSAIDKIKTLPLGDIEKVEILKSPQNLAIFGTEGANGVIAVYTRKGKSDTSSALAKGVIEQKIAGFSSFQTFYSPVYLPETDLSEKPDYRTTLFWEPEIVLQNGQAELSFFTDDQTGNYKVIVEGISESGKICRGSAEFEVVAPTGN